MATVPTPATQTAGLVVPAATINSQGNLATYLAGRVESGGARRPLASLRQSVVQSIPNAADTAILFDVEEFDYDSGHSTVTNTDQYVAQTAGQYVVTFTVAFASNATGLRKAYLQKNGANGVVFAISAAISGDATTISGSRTLGLSVGDILHVMANQNSTAALNTVVSGTQQSLMSVQWIST